MRRDLRVNVPLSPDEHETLTRLARATQRTRPSVVRCLLRRAVEERGEVWLTEDTGGEYSSPEVRT